MTDQNNLARGYSSDVSEEDPLAELARIVSGQETVVRKPAVSPFQQPASQPTARSAATAAAVVATAVKAPAAPVSVEAPAFDLEDALMAELGFGDEPQTAAPQVVSEPDAVSPVVEPEPVAIAEEALSLEDQLLAELSFEDHAPAIAYDASLAVAEAQIDLPDAEAVEEYAGEPAGPYVAEQFEEPVEFEEPIYEHDGAPVDDEPAYVAEPAVEAHVEEPREEAEYDELAAILQELSNPQPAGNEHHEEYHQEYAEDYFDEPEQADAPDPLENIDFGSAFEAELRQMEVAAPVAASVTAIRKPHVSLATPVVPRREAASERELEDHFATAFAQELDLGVAHAMEKGSNRKDAVPAYKQAAPAATQYADEDDLNAVGHDDPAEHWDPENWDDAYSQDPGHDGDELDRGIAAMVPPAGGRSRGFKLAVGALGVAGLVCAAAIAVAFTGKMDNVASVDPVIVKADTTPVKVKPENPGGLEIANQDQVVYDKVSGGEQGAGEQEKLVSAAEEPISIANVTEENPAAAASGDEPLAASDAAMAGSDVMPADAKADARLAPVAEDAANTVPALAPRRVKTMLIKPDGTVIPAEEGAAEPVVNTAALVPDTAASPALDPIEAAASAVPAETAAPVEAPATAAPDTTQVASTPPADATAITGEWAVQLASQRSAEDAQATFQNLKNKFPEVLGGKPLAVQRAEVEGKGVFYRVRVPAQTKEEAVALCEQLKAAGGSCFIAR
jgi:hypothetical protein